MSAIVFAGGAQFAALELWRAPIPWVALVVATLAVNVRHVVLGAALHNWLRRISPFKRYLAVALLSDANWAASRRAYDSGERDVGHLVGGGAIIWLAWLAGTLTGALAGERLGDLNRFGLDVVLPVFFACSLAGLAKNWRDVVPWLVAAAVACVASAIVPGNSHVIIGGLAGGLTGALIDARR